MKKLLLLLTAAIVLSSCSSEDKAQSMIKDYLSKNMNDFKSYEPVEFSVDTLLVHRFDGHPDGEEMLKDSITYQRKVNEHMNGATDSLDRYTALLSATNDKLNAINAAFVPGIIGFEVTHRFRGKNALGALVINEYTFFIEPDFKEAHLIKDSTE